MRKGPLLLIGATSDIGISIAYKFAEHGYDIQLAARNMTFIESEKINIEKHYGVRVSIHELDILKIQSHEKFLRSLNQMPEVAVSAVGYLKIQKESELNSEISVKIFRTNFEGPANIFGLLANYFEKRGSGTLIGISSVAGERGRGSNYIYGSSKAGFTAFLSGLRNRLSSKNVHVMTVLPGFVKTKMTSKITSPKPFSAKPDDVSKAVFNGFKKKKNIIYVLPIWKFIMLIIKSIPEFIFKKLSL